MPQQFDYYQAPRAGSLAPSFNMLLQAEMEAAKARGAVFNGLVDASKLAVDSYFKAKALKQERESDQGRLALGERNTRVNEREADLREREYTRKSEQDLADQAAWGELLRMGYGGAQQPGATGIAAPTITETAPTSFGRDYQAGASTPFPRGGAASTFDARAILANGAPQQPMAQRGGDAFGEDMPPPELMARFSPDKAPAVLAAWRQMGASRQLADERTRKAQARAAAQSDVQKMLSLDTANPTKEPIFSEADKLQIRATAQDDPETAAKTAAGIYKTKVTRAAAAENAALAAKELRKAIKPEDPERAQKLASIIDFENYAKTEQDPEKINAKLAERQAYIHGYDEKARTEAGKPKEKTFDFGDGQKRVVPTAVSQGGEMPAGRFPPAVEAWTRSVALDQMARDPRLLGENGKFAKPEEKAAIEQSYYDRVRQQVQANFGWQETVDTQGLQNARNAALSGTTGTPGPKPAPPQPAAPAPKALAELTPEQRSEAAKIMASKGQMAAAEYLMRVRRENGAFDIGESGLGIDPWGTKGVAPQRSVAEPGTQPSAEPKYISKSGVRQPSFLQHPMQFTHGQGQRGAQELLRTMAGDLTRLSGNASSEGRKLAQRASGELDQAVREYEAAHGQMPRDVAEAVASARRGFSAGPK